MDTILRLDQHEMGLRESSDSEIVKVREAARAVLVDSIGRVGIMFFTTTGSYKLAGGGVDEGEPVVDALHREVCEETGYTITDIRELGIVEEQRYFCGIHQKSYCYLARTDEFVGTNLTAGEEAGGMELRWVDSIEKAIECIQQSSQLLEGEPRAGLEMMKVRETAILRAAEGVL